jgi:hypothetical protein
LAGRVLIKLVIDGQALAWAGDQKIPIHKVNQMKYWQHWLFKEIRGKCLALRSAINRTEGRRQPWWETAKMRCQTLPHITDEINRRQKVGLWQRRGKPKTPHIFHKSTPE